jgi:hypothetical protein
MQIARPAAPGTNGELSRQVCLPAGSERSGFLVSHAGPFDVVAGSDGIRDAAGRISGKTINIFDAHCHQCINEHIGHSFVVQNWNSFRWLNCANENSRNCLRLPAQILNADLRKERPNAVPPNPHTDNDRFARAFSSQFSAWLTLTGAGLFGFQSFIGKAPALFGNLLVIPSILLAHDPDVRIPGRFVAWPAGDKAINCQIAQGLFTGTTNRMKRRWWNANHIGGSHSIFHLPGTNS